MPPSAAATIEASIMPLLLSVMVVSVVLATTTVTAVRAAVVVGEWQRAVGLLMGLGGRDAPKGNASWSMAAAGEGNEVVSVVAGGR